MTQVQMWAMSKLSQTQFSYLLLEVKTENNFNYKPLSAQFLFLLFFFISRFGGQLQQCDENRILE